jgi:hypothetical protein
VFIGVGRLDVEPGIERTHELDDPRLYRRARLERGTHRVQITVRNKICDGQNDTDSRGDEPGAPTR